MIFNYKNFLLNENEKSGYTSSIGKDFLDFFKGKKRMVTVYTKIDELPEKYKKVVDELLNNCDPRKLNKIYGKYCYGDYKSKLYVYKEGNKFKSYLGLVVPDKYNDRIRVYDEIHDIVLNTIKSNIEKVDRVTRINNHYDLKKHGSIGYDEDDSVKVGWGNKNQQEKRWDILLNMGFKDGDSILDFGCGIGDLYGYMKKRYNNFQYLGVDINSEYINTAMEKYPGVNFKVINDILDVKFNYDWFIASGSFTVYTTIRNLITCIDNAYNQCKKGVSFNLINSRYYPNIDDIYEKRRGYDPTKIYNIFGEKYKNIKMVDKYLKPNKDFTIGIFKK